VEAEVTNVIGEIVDGTPGNVMVLFPTMKEAEKYHKRVVKLGRPGVVPLLDSGIDTAQVKDKFFMLGTNGKKAVLFTYIWGKLAEGVDFKYDRLRTVVIVGVPYKSLDDLNKALQHSYDVLYKKGKQYGMTYPTIRRVRQAVGRVVRAPDDFGARILVDNRYTSGDKWSFLSVHNEFPDGEKKEIKDAQPGQVKAKLEGFFGKIKND
jgi:DNA excision repair protein ERCC-2